MLINFFGNTSNHSRMDEKSSDYDNVLNISFRSLSTAKLVFDSSKLVAAVVIDVLEILIGHKLDSC